MPGRLLASGQRSAGGRVALVGAVLLGLAPSAAQAATLSFSFRVDTATGTNPRSVVSGDFNGDGKPDLATANQGVNTVSVLLGNGDGTFILKSTPATGATPYSVVSGDFNGDGNPDLATANSGVSTVSVLLGKGDGTFSLKSSPATGSTPFSVTTGDFNGDGKADLATANLNANTLSVLLGKGDGTFALKSTPATGAAPFSVIGGDFNGDGKPDLVTSNQGANTVSVLLGKGDGTFSLKSTSATGARPQSVVSEDFNGDGKTDLATANQSANTVSVLLGNGDGTFTPKSTPATGAIPFSVTSGDFDGDGKADLATANSGASTVSVLLGKGDGTFSLASSPGTRSTPRSVVSSDFNGDGKPDLATADTNTNAVSVLLNASTLPPTVTTGIASPITSTTATLNATINTQNLETTARLQYGTTTAYGGEAPITLTPTNGTTAQAVTATISGLTPFTLYHFRVVATNIGGTTNGSDVTFRTLEAPSLVVTTASDVVSSTDGVTSLREAINTANTHAGTDTVSFAIPGTGIKTIQLVSALPTLTDNSTTIDGFSQSGARANTLATGSNAVINVKIRGVGLTRFKALIVGAANCTVRGLSITNCSFGIYITGSVATGNKVTGNYVGVLADGATALGNDSGITIEGASGNTIGGMTAGERNVISGNNAGVTIVGPSTTGNSVTGNYFGTNASGTTGLANGFGVEIDSAPGNVIGGTSAGERNIISGNLYGLIIGNFSMPGNTATGNSVTGNYIGTTADGSAKLANGSGVLITGASSNTIGGVTVGAGNLISGNTSFGVSITGSAPGNSVRGNSIYANGSTPSALGIDLNNDGVTANDAGDMDGLQNFPVLLSSSTQSENTTITGTLNSTANATFTLDFYSSPSADTSGYGEGQTYLGSATVMADDSGNAPFTATFTGVSVASGAAISATATGSAGNTSEFCKDISNSLQNSTSVTSAAFSKFRRSGPNRAADQSIRLANMTGTAINLTGWTLTAGTVTSALSGLSFTGKMRPVGGEWRHRAQRSHRDQG